MTGEFDNPRHSEPDHAFDHGYWEDRWKAADPDSAQAMGGPDANPHVVGEVGHLSPGRALDAGCGNGSESLWLAAHGWRVTGVDISPTALRAATQRAGDQGLADRISWIEADLTRWAPPAAFDLVVTNYVHPAMPHLAFYRRIADWVAPGGTLLIVGHLHDHAHDVGHGGHGNHSEHGPPVEATVTLADVRGVVADPVWEIDTAEERTRTAPRPGGRAAHLRDVVVRATRQA